MTDTLKTLVQDTTLATGRKIVHVDLEPSSRQRLPLIPSMSLSAWASASSEQGGRGEIPLTSYFAP